MKQKSVWKRLLEMAAMVCMLTLMLGITSLAADKVENLALGQAVTNVDEDGSITHCYKFSVKSSGAVTVSAMGVNGSYYTGLYISLCNAKGKELTKEYVNGASDNTSTQAVTFGVNKGTYQIKIQTPYRFVLQANFTKYQEKSGSSQKKAVAIKKGVVKKGVVGIGEAAKKVDWYKITLKKSAKITLTFDTVANSSIYATIIPSKSTKVKGTYDMWSYNQPVSRVFQLMPGSRKLPAGTYYVKVYRGRKDASVNGIYALKWK